MTVALANVLTPVASGNVIGIDSQNFNPTTSGLDFVTVHSSETLEPGVLSFGLFLNYAVNTLPFFDDTVQGFDNLTDTMLGGDINVGLGLLPNLDVGLSFPQLLFQSVKSDGYRGQFQKNGQTEIRLNAKYRLWGDREGGMAFVASTNINRIENNPYVGSGSQPTVNAEIVADTTIKKIALGLNVGYRWRKAGEKTDPDSPIDPIASQYIASAAASYLLTDLDTKIIFEVFGSAPATTEETENSDRLASSAEALLGLKYDFSASLAGHFGMGRELTHGRSSPDYRAYAGLNYVLGPTIETKQPAKVVGHGRAASSPQPTLFDGPVKSKEKIVIHDVLFEFDSAEIIVSTGEETLRKLMDHVNKRPGYNKLVIEGHTDSVGTDDYNLKLSQRRSQTIKRLLVEKYGANASKIMAVGRGERAPIADNGNYQGRQLNRRVEFTIYRPTH